MMLVLIHRGSLLHESTNKLSVPINEHSGPEIVSNEEPPVDLANCFCESDSL